MKHKAHMNRFTALNTAMSVSFAAFGLFAASAASAENYISISSDAGVQRPNYNNDGATDRFGMAIQRQQVIAVSLSVPAPLLRVSLLPLLVLYLMQTVLPLRPLAKVRKQLVM